MFLKRYRRKRPPPLLDGTWNPPVATGAPGRVWYVPVHTKPPSVTPCANILKLFFFIFEREWRGMTRSFVGPALVRGTAAVFFVCIRIDGGRMVPLIFGPMTVSDGIEEKKREKFPSRNLFSFSYLKKKGSGARVYLGRPSWPICKTRRLYRCESVKSVVEAIELVGIEICPSISLFFLTAIFSFFFLLNLMHFTRRRRECFFFKKCRLLKLFLPMDSADCIDIFHIFPNSWKETKFLFSLFLFIFRDFRDVLLRALSAAIWKISRLSFSHPSLSDW